MGEERTTPVLEYSEARRPQFPWHAVGMLLLALVLIGVAIIGLRALPPIKWTESRRCLVCGRYEELIHTWFWTTTVPRFSPMGPLEAWIAGHGTPCGHNWEGWRTSETGLLTTWSADVNAGTSSAYLVDSTMLMYQVSDDAVADAVRLLRVGDRTGIMRVTERWQIELPRRKTLWTPTTTPTHP